VFFHPSAELPSSFPSVHLVTLSAGTVFFLFYFVVSVPFHQCCIFAHPYIYIQFFEGLYTLLECFPISVTAPEYYNTVIFCLLFLADIFLMTLSISSKWYPFALTICFTTWILFFQFFFIYQNRHGSVAMVMGTLVQFSSIVCYQGCWCCFLLSTLTTYRHLCRSASVHFFSLNSYHQERWCRILISQFPKRCLIFNFAICR